MRLSRSEGGCDFTTGGAQICDLRQGDARSRVSKSEFSAPRAGERGMGKKMDLEADCLVADLRL